MGGGGEVYFQASSVSFNHALREANVMADGFAKDGVFGSISFDVQLLPLTFQGFR